MGSSIVVNRTASRDSTDGESVGLSSEGHAPLLLVEESSRRRGETKIHHAHTSTTIDYGFLLRPLLPRLSWMSSTRVIVLLVLCLQNSFFTVVRRYSLGFKRESYSKYEVLLVGEIIKLVFSAYMVVPPDAQLDQGHNSSYVRRVRQRLGYLIATSGKMVGLAVLYGAMNILSLVSLRNIGAGMFTIFAQCKILTTAVFSTIILQRQYSPTQWRALFSLSLGVLLFSQPIWDTSTAGAGASAITDPHGGHGASPPSSSADANVLLGTLAVLIEVTLSGFASIYFEKVIKTDPLQLSIWERNFQLAFGSLPVYVVFMMFTTPSLSHLGAGWTVLGWAVALLGAAGGLLVALSIKYGDSILKTLATTGAILLSSVLDHLWLGGPLTPAMMIAAVQVILAICNYTFDATPPATALKEVNAEPSSLPTEQQQQHETNDEEMAMLQPTVKR